MTNKQSWEEVDQIFNDLIPVVAGEVNIELAKDKIKRLIKFVLTSKSEQMERLETIFYPLETRRTEGCSEYIKKSEVLEILKK